MKIELDKKQYENLLKLVYLGNWLVNAIRSGAPGDEQIEKFNKIEQLIFSLAKDAGFEKYVEFSEEFKEFFPTVELEEELEEYIEGYDEDNFWQELHLRLSQRDFFRKYGKDAISKMTLKERIAKEQPFDEKYGEELEKHGLENLEIVNKKHQSA